MGKCTDIAQEAAADQKNILLLDSHDTTSWRTIGVQTLVVADMRKNGLICYASLEKYDE
jgi:hypothetical protein